MTNTATCADCDRAWRGPNAYKYGISHQDILSHVVWYDEDPDTTETADWEGVATDEPIGNATKGER